MPDEPTPPNTDDTPPPTPPPPPPAAKDDLGDAGKKALDEERKARRDAERRAKTFEDELAKEREKQLGDSDRAVAEAKRAGAKEATDKVMARLFTAEARAISAGKLADPTLLADPLVAQRLLGLDAIPMTKDDEIDSDAVAKAIDALLEARPYLRAGAGPAGTNGGRAPGTPDAGRRGGDAPDLGELPMEQYVQQFKARGAASRL